MKTLLASFFLGAAIITVPAQSNYYSLNIVGYVNKPFAPGNTLFSNPLDNGVGNTLSTLFPTNLVTSGATVSLWNASTLAYDPVSTFQSGAWTLNLTLNPGTGALFTSPTGASVFTNTFIGNVVSRDGGPLTEPFALPPIYTGPNGLFLLSDVLPMGSAGTNIFLNILGRLPAVGEQVITLNSTSTYLGGDSWIGGTPTLGVAEAVFLNVGPVPVPEPAVFSLLFFAAAGLLYLRRR